ncbi:MAG: DUF4910 domain-containing protein [Proteobacteria bacterium]|nr:DUF4910 domain-containing protein [Pseudomonadota bacterium]
MDRSNNLATQLVAPGTGDAIYAFAAKMFPICRSITGDGVRETLRLIAEHISLDVHEMPTGASVFDWTIPKEWNIRDAYIRDARGEKIVDFANSNLHVMSYSVPVNARLSLTDLKKRIHTLPKQPDLIPYRTSYYSEDWGFCMTHRQLESLKDETYEVVIDSSLADGALTYAEHLHRGETEEEILLSAHTCHPSLANDNCSAVALLTLLAERIGAIKTRYSYRFLFTPGTIGAIAWLSENDDKVGRIKHGLVLAGVGDRGAPTYKRSRNGNREIDRVLTHALAQTGRPATILDFSPYGYNERQFCSPGFDLSVGLFQRSLWGSFPEYHTSADNLDFIRPDSLEDSYRIIANAIDILEGNRIYRNTLPKCEPQLGKRGLYAAIANDADATAKNMAMLWLLNLSDGTHSLLDIAERGKIPFQTIKSTAALLAREGLLK